VERLRKRLIFTQSYERTVLIGDELMSEPNLSTVPRSRNLRWWSQQQKVSLGL
jgi:hypothetical protein